MKSKKGMELRIRGWLPSEPTLLSRSSYKPSRRGYPFMVWWLAAAVAVGLAVAAALIALGNLAGFTAFTASANLWYIEVCFVAWCSAGLLAVYGYVRKLKSRGEIQNEHKTAE